MCVSSRIDSSAAVATLMIEESVALDATVRTSLSNEILPTTTPLVDPVTSRPDRFQQANHGSAGWEPVTVRRATCRRSTCQVHTLNSLTIGSGSYGPAILIHNNK